MVSPEGLADSSVSIYNSLDKESTDSSSECINNQQLMLAEDGQMDSSQFGNVAISNSTDIHIGNKTIYQGPVTIKQLVCNNSEMGQVCAGDKVDQSGNKCYDNPGFVRDTCASGDSDNKMDVHKGKHRWPSLCSQQHLLAISTTAAVLVVSVVTLLAVLMIRHQDPLERELSEGIYENHELENNTPIEYPVDKNSTVILPPKLRLIKRSEWLAQPPSDPIANLSQPVEYIIVSHTATEQCFDQASCTFYVRLIQTFHLESRNWSDIAYNFLVGGDGAAYEGRGWTKQGAHTFGYNYKSIGISFIGTFNTVKAPERQIAAAKQLIEMGIKRKYVREDYKLIGAKQTQTTLSPGAELFEEIKTWPHFAPHL